MYMLYTCRLTTLPDCLSACHCNVSYSSTDRFNLSQERLTEEFGTPVQCQRLWWWTRRQNNTYRVDRPLTTEEEKIPVSKHCDHLTGSSYCFVLCSKNEALYTKNIVYNDSFSSG